MWQQSEAVRNAKLDSIEATIGTAPLLRLYENTGALPANCAAATTGTQLASTTLPTDWMAAAATGSKALLGTWAATATAAGTFHYWRMFNSAGTTCHGQGQLARPHVASTAYAIGQRVTNANNTYRCTTAGTSGAATPPTGTGTANDGTVVWTYETDIGGVLVPDFYTVTTGQNITVSAYTMNAGNA